MANYPYKAKGVLTPYLADLPRVDLGGVQCAAVTEGQMRATYLNYGGSMVVTIVAVDGGYAVRSLVQGSVFGTYIEGEHSKSMRLFKRLDTAINVCRRMGLCKVVVEL
jgi:hypothetical protein